MPSTFPRRGTFSEDPDSYAEDIRAVCAQRDRWLDYGLKAGPADRSVAEHAVAQLYRSVGFDEPEFHWVPSPRAAATFIAGRHLARTPSISTAGTEVDAAIATMLSDSRRRMDRIIERRHIEWPREHRWATVNGSNDFRVRGVIARGTPIEAALAGISPDPIIDRTVRTSLHTSLFDGIATAIRTTTPRPFGSITWYGQQEAHRVAYYDAFRRHGLARFSFEDVELLDVQTALIESTGWWWAFENIAVMAERPAAVHVEPLPDSPHGEVRLHNSDGPAVEFADGSAVHVLSGTVVPSWVIRDPTVDRITVERNVEVRRSAIERIGWDTYLEQAGLRLVDAGQDPGNPGCTLELYAAPEGWQDGGRILLAVNGSRERDGRRRRYGLRVPAAFTSAIDAAGWTYGLAGADYARLLRRT
ncbi:hypothetical protein HQP42_10190 [Rhodococcus fascians]|nr:hypothetical protein [Rhodococcus fascians]MBY3825261.1 hypothetical protein [Rhodococcus fascians]MBY3835722.1 hypothetical protein [Rhodococcus fascians]MBY3864934.1 hypothetical protein [Rhodococcus fascians]MBY3884664.1 hypothetical protein [Rhodococcus fascians]